VRALVSPSNLAPLTSRRRELRDGWRGGGGGGGRAGYIDYLRAKGCVCSGADVRAAVAAWRLYSAAAPAAAAAAAALAAVAV
jgi:hypothetical protein